MRAVRPLVLFAIGGLVYLGVEMLYRGHSHWTMFFVGGVCFVMVGAINEVIPCEMPLWKQAVIGSLIITAVEFVSGCVINLWLGWNVWDYSNLPFNVLGQICLPFSVLWVVVSVFGIILDDYLRYWLFGEDKPQYKLK